MFGTRVELRVSCSDLPNVDHFSKTDPFVVLQLRDEDDGTWYEVGRTEVVYDNLSPSFAHAFLLSFTFEEAQNLRLSVYDHERDGEDLSLHQFIASTTTTLSEILALGCRLTRPLQAPKGGIHGYGTITITCEEVRDYAAKVRMALSARELDRKHIVSTDPFLVISRLRRIGDEDEFVPVYNGEVARRTSAPEWNEVILSGQKLCNGDVNRTLLFQVFDHRVTGQHVLIGEFMTTLAELQRKRSREFVLQKHQRSGRLRHDCGTVFFRDFAILREHTFLDYLTRGCQISLIVGIDFTMSNGHPSMPKSLHYRDSDRPNEYVLALRAVGDILIHYDSDNMVPVYGFGAKMPGEDSVSHCFNVNLRNDNSEVHQVEGIVDAYYKALDALTLAGPTHLHEVLNLAIREASEHASQNDQRYYILVIVTDGICNDMQETIDSIIRASSLPLSIVVVGVGDADFKDMVLLDADDKALEVNGRRMERDIVQFVPFRNFRKKPSLLAKETLEEIPGQFLSYMNLHGITPMAPIDHGLGSHHGARGFDDDAMQDDPDAQGSQIHRLQSYLQHRRADDQVRALQQLQRERNEQWDSDSAMTPRDTSFTGSFGTPVGASASSPDKRDQRPPTRPRPAAARMARTQSSGPMRRKETSPAAGQPSKAAGKPLFRANSFHLSPKVRARSLSVSSERSAEGASSRSGIFDEDEGV